MKISELDPQQMSHVLTKIEELEKSDGWIMLKRIMATEREEFFRKIAAPTATIVPEVVHYQRGIIEGTYRMADLPDRLIAELKNQITLVKATQAAQTPSPTNQGNP